LSLAVPAFATVQWRNGTGAETPPGSTNPGDIDDVIYDNIVAPLDNLLADGRFGCKLAYASAATLTVGAGSIVLSNTADTVRLMARNLSATTVAWTDIDTGSEAASTTYYLYAIASAVSDTVFTVKISTSSSLPAEVTYYKRLGYFTNNSDSNISSIIDDGRYETTLVGTIQMYGGSSAPTGWLMCDGTAVSRTTYAALYNIIGTSFGTGNGSTTFNVPDFVNRFPYGASAGTDAGNADIGSEGGTAITGNDTSLTSSTGSTTPPSRYDGNDSTGVGAHTHTYMPQYLAINFIIKT